MKTLEDFLKLTQNQLFIRLAKKYQKNAIYDQGKYILVKGEAPVLLLAHLDTVHKTAARTICTSQQGNILMSPQGVGGDDRCGVYALVTLGETSAVKPWLLFTCDEEIGGRGAKAFAEDYLDEVLPKEMKTVKMIIEIDRKWHQEAVYYNCGNEEFEDYISGKGFKTACGSFSDISIIAPAMGIAAVNLSAGYYNAHTLHEYINKKHLHFTIRKVREIIEEASKKDFPIFEYVENIWKEQDYYGRIVPWNLPNKYYEVYDRLLDYFKPKEIDCYRKTYGDSILKELYAQAIGM